MYYYVYEYNYAVYVIKKKCAQELITDIILHSIFLLNNYRILEL